MSDSEVIRDAVLLLQGINGHYTQFQEPDSDVKRSNHGLPIHPLEHDVGEVSIVGPLSFLHLDDTVCTGYGLFIVGRTETAL